MIEVSVIVPVFNIGQYLEKCIKSLINQSIFDNMEIILVNDGSIDKSADICNAYSREYENITLYEQDNSGVSAARNAGIKLAKGKYIGFVDGDDYVEADFFESMLGEIKQDDNQLVVFDYFIDLPNGKQYAYRNNYPRKKWNGNSLMKDFLGGYVGQNLFDKLYVTDLVKDIEFDSNIRIGEDFLFIFEYILKVNKASGVFAPGYHYVQREGSAMNVKFNEKMFDPLIASERILNWAQENSEFYDYAYAYHIHTAYKLLERAYKSGEYVQYKEKIKQCGSLIKNYSFIKAKKYLSKKQFIGFMLMRISPKAYLTVCRLKNI